MKNLNELIANASRSGFNVGKVSSGIQTLSMIPVGIVVGLVLTILLYAMVFPESRKNTLNGFFTFVRNFFDMKYLIIEKIMKFLYVFETMAVICVGFFLLFGETFVIGLSLMVVGPILFRLLYEGQMIFILLVKNTMDINNKIEGKGKTKGNQFDGSIPKPKFETRATVRPVYAGAQGGTFTQNAAQAYVAPTAPAATSAPHICPTCASQIPEGSVFCTNCGTKIG